MNTTVRLRKICDKSSELAAIARDAPIRLSIAAELAFPDGTMTVSGLRKEASRGRLIVERIAGKDFTTLNNIDRMRELCRVLAKERTSTNAELASEDASSLHKLSGLLKTAVGISPQDALRARLKPNHPGKQSKP